MFFKKFVIFIIFPLFLCCLLFSAQEKKIVFETIEVQEGDTFEGLFGPDWEIVSYINRIDSESLEIGQKLKVPMDMILANNGQKSILSTNWNYVKKLIYEYPFMPKILPREKRTAKLISVVISEQFIGCYKYGKLKFSYPISSGRRTYPTRRGRFKVYYKRPYHVSSIFGDPMPWTLMFNPRGQAFHAGKMPGYPASHGCIRLFKKDAFMLFQWSDIGTEVLVVDSLDDLKM